MNISNEWLNTLRRELPVIIFVTTLHMWLCFHFPAYIRLGFPSGYIVSMAMSILGVVAYVIMFTFPQQIVSYLKFEQVDETLPGGHILKKFMPVWIIAVYNISMFVMWYKDFYRMPTAYYMMLYMYCVLVYVLLFRAAKKYSCPCESDNSN
jgi:hypothetical protein